MSPVSITHWENALASEYLLTIYVNTGLIHINLSVVCVMCICLGILMNSIMDFIFPNSRIIHSVQKMYNSSPTCKGVLIYIKGYTVIPTMSPSNIVISQCTLLGRCCEYYIYSACIILALPLLRLLSSKAQGRKDL